MKNFIYNINNTKLNILYLKIYYINNNKKIINIKNI